MRARIGVLPVCGQQFLVAHRREEVEHALAGLPRALQESRARLVGACFLFAREGEEAPCRDVLAAHDERHARIALAGGDRAHAQDHRGDHRHAHALEFLAPLHEMAARHVPRFMRDHADEFRRRIHNGDEAGMHEELLPVRHEGVEVLVVHEMDFHRARIDSRSQEHGVGIFPQHGLGFGIADDRDAALRRRGQGGVEAHSRARCQGAKSAQAPSQGSFQAGIRAGIHE